MKRILTFGVILVIIASIFVFTLNTNNPHAGDNQVALCKANVYETPSLTNANVLVSLSKGEEFTLTGEFKSADNGKGARYTLWEGTTADGVTGWVKANAFTETDSHGY